MTDLSVAGPILVLWGGPLPPAAELSVEVLDYDADAWDACIGAETALSVLRGEW